MNPPTRKILLCVTGLSPQVVTETLYALAVEGNFLPDEIHLITSREGAQRAELTLLGDDPDQRYFYRLCDDYGIDAGHIRFDSSTIHIIGKNGILLDDIRTVDDNEAAADTITRVVRELTADAASIVHASIAGGRKTMGFYLGYAMSLFGRSQDGLSHVLVSAPFESHPQFFYKPARSRVLYDRNDRPVRTDEAVITLAPIPFVRLRDGLGEAIRDGGVSFSQAVAQAQRAVGPPELVLDATKRQVRCGDTLISLNAVDFAFYAWFARRLLAGRPAIHWSCEDGTEFLAEYAAVINPHSGEYDRAEKSLKNGMTKEYFEPRLSHLRKKIRNALGTGPAQPYQISPIAKIPGTHYRLQGLTLQPEQVRFADLEMSASLQVDHTL